MIFRSWALYTFNIEIDEAEKTILFQNIITRKVKRYFFHDFDAYFDTYPVTGKGGAYKVLYLTKEKRAEKIISGFYYSNIDEMQNALASIKYLGYQKYFSLIARRVLFNKPILEK